MKMIKIINGLIIKDHYVNKNEIFKDKIYLSTLHYITLYYS